MFLYNAHNKALLKFYISRCQRHVAIGMQPGFNYMGMSNIFPWNKRRLSSWVSVGSFVQFSNIKPTSFFSLLLRADWNFKPTLHKTAACRWLSDPFMRLFLGLCCLQISYIKIANVGPPLKCICTSQTSETFADEAFSWSSFCSS